jgi:hypothetical protein
MLRDQMSGMDRWGDGDGDGDDRRKGVGVGVGVGVGRVEEDEDELMLSPNRPGGEFWHTHTPLIYANTSALIYV